MNWKLREIFLIALLIHGAGRVLASHEVGGEIRVTYLSGTQYEIKVLNYYDWSGTPISPAGTASISIYDRANVSSPLQTFLVPITSIDSTQNYPCGTTFYDFATASYTTTINLSPTVYNSPAGYILVHSRSPSPILPNISTNVFAHYTLIPPVADGSGNQIINSSPVSSKEFETVIVCTLEDMRLDMSSIDPDGDSLAYTFYTPASASTIGPGLINAKFSPYTDPSTQFPAIQWAPGFSEDTQIKGSLPDSANNKLRINPVTGMSVVNPLNFQGIHMVAVAVEEYRDLNNDGVKEIIGVVYRILAYNVMQCPWYVNQAGSISLQTIDTSSYFCGSQFIWPNDTLELCSYTPNYLGLEFADSDTNTTVKYEVESSLNSTFPCGVSLQDSILTKQSFSDTLRNAVRIYNCEPHGAVNEITVFIEDQHPCGKVLNDTLKFWVKSSLPESLEQETPDEIKVYPNPSSGSFSIAIQESMIGTRAEIYSYDMRRVQTLELNSINNSLEIDLPGLYFMITEGHFELRKLIVR